MKEKYRTKNITLRIDTANLPHSVEISSGADILDRFEIEGGVLSETLLTKIELLLKNNLLNKEDLFQIQVNTGPGSYTSLRIGITVANLLAYSLDIPVVALGGGTVKGSNYNKPVLPYYNQEPKITKKKS